MWPQRFQSLYLCVGKCVLNQRVLKNICNTSRLHGAEPLHIGAGLFCLEGHTAKAAARFCDFFLLIQCNLCKHMDACSCFSFLIHPTSLDTRSTGSRIFSFLFLALQHFVLSSYDSIVVTQSPARVPVFFSKGQQKLFLVLEAQTSNNNRYLCL